MERRELRHDRHTGSLLTDHTVFSPKYRGKILVEKTIALALDGIIRKTCKDLNIEIIDMAVNVDHVHLFTKYPPKYSVSYIAKRIKGRSSRVFSWLGWSWMGGCGEIHTESGEAKCEIAMYRLRT
jgi:putative transposase